MSETANEWIGTVLKLSGETQVTRGILVGAIEMLENNLAEFGDEDDLKTLEELEEMLYHSE